MRRGAAPGPSWRNWRSATAGARPGRADGAAGLAPGRPRRRPGPAGIVDGPGPRPLGSAADPARAGRAGARRIAGRRARPATRYKRRWRPATPAPVAPRTPTGRASWRCTTRWSRPCPSPVAELNRAVAVGMAFGPRAALDLVDALEAEARWPITTGCPACAATSWPSWAGMQRRAGLRTRRRHDPQRPRTRAAAGRAEMRTARPDARVLKCRHAPRSLPPTNPRPPWRACRTTFDHPDDRAEFRRPGHRPGVELYRAHIIRHAFDPTPDAFGLGAIESGVERFRYRGADHLAPSGSVVLMNPDELHTGRAETEGGWRCCGVHRRRRGRARDGRGRLVVRHCRGPGHGQRRASPPCSTPCGARVSRWPSTAPCTRCWPSSAATPACRAGPRRGRAALRARHRLHARASVAPADAGRAGARGRPEPSISCAASRRIATPRRSRC